MYDQAGKIQMAMKPINEEKLRSLGGTLEPDGSWTFPDGSRGRIRRRPIAVYREMDEEHVPYGFEYFEKIETIQ